MDYITKFFGVNNNQNDKEPEMLLGVNIWIWRISVIICVVLLVSIIVIAIYVFSSDKKTRGSKINLPSKKDGYIPYMDQDSSPSSSIDLQSSSMSIDMNQSTEPLKGQNESPYGKLPTSGYGVLPEFKKTSPYNIIPIPPDSQNPYREIPTMIEGPPTEASPYGELPNF